MKRHTFVCCHGPGESDPLLHVSRTPYLQYMTTTMDSFIWLLGTNPFLLAQSADYDFPPASNPSPPYLSVPTNPLSRGLPDVTARLDHLRNLLNSERHRDSEGRRRALDLLDRELLEASAEPMSERLNRRRRALESQVRDYDGSPSPDPDTIPINHTSSLMRARRTATRPSERLERYRQRPNRNLARPRSDINHHGSIDVGAPSGLPDRPIYRIGSPDITAQEYSGEAQVNRENRWRAKRRKIETEDLGDGFKGATYGHRGQVVSGPLKMEIVSCDGGQYSEPNGDSSWPENVLQDDSSVYCTKSDRCNIILRHQKGTPFSLRKLVIKAPKNGFDAPIQEGMIFVSSDDNNLLSRTAQYQIQYSTRRTRSRRNEFSQIRLQSSHEYYNSLRSPLRSIDRSTYLQNPFPPLRQPQNSATTPMTADFNGDYSRDRCSVPQQIPGFHVTTRFDDIDSDSEDATAQQSHSDLAEAEIDRVLNFRDPYWAEYVRPSFDREANEDLSSNSSSEEEDESPDEFLARTGIDFHDVSPEERRLLTTNDISRLMEDRHSRLLRRRRRRREPSRIEVANSDALDGNSKAAEVLAPHARFFIRRRKSCVTVRFDPPV
jgi:hypothetical protein